MAGFSSKQKLIGGFQPGQITYIGRVFTAGEMSIGKIICTERDCQGLYTTRNGKEMHHTNVHLEILTYNADAAAPTSCWYITER